MHKRIRSASNKVAAALIYIAERSLHVHRHLRDEAEDADEVTNSARSRTLSRSRSPAQAHFDYLAGRLLS